MIDIESIKSLERGGTYVVTFTDNAKIEGVNKIMQTLNNFVKDRDIKFVAEFPRIFTIK